MPTRGRLEARVTVPVAWTGTVNDSGAGGAVVFTVAAGTYYITSFVAALATALNVAATTDTLTATLSAGESGTGKVTITSSGTTAIVWTSTDMRDLLGFTTDLTSGTTWTGASQARGLWLPNCPYKAPNAVSASWRGWREADVRSVENAAGYVFGHMGQSKEVNAISWNAVSRALVWEANATTVNASWERFVRDGIWGVTTWGTPGGPIRFFPDAAVDAVYVTYRVVNFADIKPEPLVPDYVAGTWRIELPRLVADPTEAV